jgi:hypothetical protein
MVIPEDEVPIVALQSASDPVPTSEPATGAAVEQNDNAGSSMNPACPECHDKMFDKATSKNIENSRSRGDRTPRSLVTSPTQRDPTPAACAHCDSPPPALAVCREPRQ